MKKILARALTALRKLWAKEPARVVSAVAAVIVFVAAKCGAVIPAEPVLNAVALMLVPLLGGEAIRSQVAPTS